MYHHVYIAYSMMSTYMSLKSEMSKHTTQVSRLQATRPDLTMSENTLRVWGGYKVVGAPLSPRVKQEVV